MLFVTSSCPTILAVKVQERGLILISRMKPIGKLISVPAFVCLVCIRNGKRKEGRKELDFMSISTA